MAGCPAMPTPALSDGALLEGEAAAMPSLGVPGFSYADLHDPLRLADLTAAFDAEVRAVDGDLYDRYAAHRSGTAVLAGTNESDLLVDLSAHLSKFVAKL